MNISINYWSIVLSSVAGLAIGSVWYGPLFGKKFMSAVGMDTWSPEKKEAMRKSMVKTYVLQFLVSLLTYFVLAANIAYNGLSIGSGMVFAFFMWLGFILPLKIGDTLWGGNKTLAWLTAGGELVSILVAAAIIGALQ